MPNEGDNFTFQIKDSNLQTFHRILYFIIHLVFI